MRTIRTSPPDNRTVVSIVEPPTLAAVVRGLSDTKPGIVHIVAHGTSSAKGEGVLALEDEFGSTDYVGALEFSQQLGGSSASLVVLNSCLSGAGVGIHKFQGVSHALIKAGVPAVIAMQYSVPVVSAHRFSRELYRSIADGIQLPEATGLARRILATDPHLRELDWGRVAPGDCSPGAPTDPDMQNSCIRLFKSRTC